MKTDAIIIVITEQMVQGQNHLELRIRLVTGHRGKAADLRSPLVSKACLLGISTIHKLLLQSR